MESYFLFEKKLLKKIFLPFLDKTHFSTNQIKFTKRFSD